MWVLVWRAAAIRWPGYDPTRDGFDRSIVRIGRAIRRWVTRLCLARAWQTGKEFSARPRAWAALSIIWSSRKEAGIRSWKRHSAVWRHSAPRTDSGKIDACGRLF